MNIAHKVPSRTKNVKVQAESGPYTKTMITEVPSNRNEALRNTRAVFLFNLRWAIQKRQIDIT